jgi:hypothetical protein
VTGFSPSYSAAKEWWADAEDVAISSPMATAAIPFMLVEFCHETAR